MGLIGWKGANPDSVLEKVKGTYDGQVVINKE